MVLKHNYIGRIPIKLYYYNLKNIIIINIIFFLVIFIIVI